MAEIERSSEGYTSQIDQGSHQGAALVIYDCASEVRSWTANLIAQDVVACCRARSRLFYVNLSEENIRRVQTDCEVYQEDGPRMVAGAQIASA